MFNTYTKEQIDEAKEWFGAFAKQRHYGLHEKYGAVLLSALSTAEDDLEDAKNRRELANMAAENLEEQRDALKARCAELEGGLVGAIKSIDEGGAHSVKRIRKMLIEVLDAIVGKKED